VPTALRDIADGRVLGDTSTLADPTVVEEVKVPYHYSHTKIFTSVRWYVGKGDCYIFVQRLMSSHSKSKKNRLRFTKYTIENVMPNIPEGCGLLTERTLGSSTEPIEESAFGGEVR